MILADKIITLRKKNGLSQEELAEKMNVSRQSVSKWEGAQSVPDLNKIIALSEIFGVSTDYLLKDEYDEPEFTSKEDAEAEPPMKQVSMEEANSYLEANKRHSFKLAIGTALCIFSFVPLFMMGALSERDDNSMFVAFGIAGMLVFIAIAVAVFITSGNAMSDYSYLSKEPIDTAYGVEGMVKERRKAYKSTETKCITTGVLLCILGVISLVVLAILGEQADEAGEDFLAAVGLCGMFTFVAIGVFLMVKAETVMGGYNRLLEDGDFTREKKTPDKGGFNLVMIYWLVLIAAYLTVSMIAKSWNWTWIIFAAGGILTPAVMEIEKAINRKK